ncbi:hypothetical protein D3C85_1438960 [compost metagenome]
MRTIALVDVGEVQADGRLPDLDFGGIRGRNLHFIEFEHGGVAMLSYTDYVRMHTFCCLQAGAMTPCRTAGTCAFRW